MERAPPRRGEALGDGAGGIRRARLAYDEGMRSLVVGLLLLASSVVARAEAPVVRVAVAHPFELLPSEEKSLGELEKALARRKLGTVLRADASPAEVRALVAAPSTLPEEWRGVDTVVVLEILLPEGKKPKRVSRGVGHISVYHPPGLEPVWSERLEGSADIGMPATLAGWIADAITIARGAK